VEISTDRLKYDRLVNVTGPWAVSLLAQSQTLKELKGSGAEPGDAARMTRQFMDWLSG